MSEKKVAESLKNIKSNESDSLYTSRFFDCPRRNRTTIIHVYKYILFNLHITVEKFQINGEIVFIYKCKGDVQQ